MAKCRKLHTHQLNEPKYYPFFVANTRSSSLTFCLVTNLLSVKVFWLLVLFLFLIPQEEWTWNMCLYWTFSWFSSIKLDTVRNRFSNRTTRSHFQPLSLETNSCHVFYLRTWHILQLAPFTCSHQHIIMGGMKTSITLTGSAFSILQLLAGG